jgi:hypothetical protein
MLGHNIVDRHVIHIDYGVIPVQEFQEITVAQHANQLLVFHDRNMVDIIRFEDGLGLV